MFTPFFQVSILLLQLVKGFEVSTVQNFRPVFPQDPECRFFRSAALDQLSEEDAQCLLSNLGYDLTVIDLRNDDEIKKDTRSAGSLFFYEQIDNLHHVPILANVNAFWDEAISQMDGPTKVMATLQTITQAGALDRAAARMLEENGLSMLYAILLTTAINPLQRAMSICGNAPGSVLFHCQKGKDRTGIIAMLLQSCRKDPLPDQEIIEQYAMSGELLGESPGSKPAKRSSGTMLDWSRLRGSPASAMEETLNWVRQRHGSVQEYITNTLRIDSATLEKLSK